MISLWLINLAYNIISLLGLPMTAVLTRNFLTCNLEIREKKKKRKEEICQEQTYIGKLYKSHSTINETLILAYFSKYVALLRDTVISS